MINVDVIPAENNIFLIRFSEPDERFADKPYIPVNGKDEIIRRLYFKNRHYISETLLKWLNQRKHAAKHDVGVALNLSNALINLKNASIFTLCDFILNNRRKFEQIAPPDSSNCRKYYQTKIVPILNFKPTHESELQKFFNGNKTSGFVDTEG